MHREWISLGMVTIGVIVTTIMYAFILAGIVISIF